MQISLDLTPWQRGPRSGIGLSAWRTAQALKPYITHEFQIELISRDFRKRIPEINYLHPLRRWLGRPDEIYHAFQLHLPPLKRSKRVLTVHDCWTLWDNPFQPKNFQKKQSVRLLRSIERADLIITPSKHVAQQLIEYCPHIKNRIHTIPWGPHEHSQNQNIEPSVTKYLSQKRRYILNVGMISARKNQNLAAQAIAWCGEDVDLVLAGQMGYGHTKVMREIDMSGVNYVHFHQLNDASLEALYQNCELVMLPSLDEGFGMPALEAIGFGKALFCSDIPSFREIADNACEYFSLQDNPKLIGEKLREILIYPQKLNDLGQQGIKRSQLFSWQKTAQSHWDLYKTLGR